MLPALRLVFKRGNTVAGIDRVFDAAAPLAHVVGQQQERLAPEQDDRHEVDEGHEGHRDVGQAPGQVERGEKSLTIASLEKIVEGLGISFSDLFENLQPPTKPASYAMKCYNIVSSYPEKTQKQLYDVLCAAEKLAK